MGRQTRLLGDKADPGTGGRTQREGPCGSTQEYWLRSDHATIALVQPWLVALWNGPYWWMVPMVIILLMASVVFIALQAAPLIAPFVYGFAL